MKKDVDKALKNLAASWWEAEQEHIKALERCPDNGRFGTWVVEDDRHRVEVETDSAVKAWEAAKDKHAWWAWDVTYLGCHQ